VQNYASYLIFSSSNVGQRQKAAKLFIQAMHNGTMREKWVIDEEWVRHIHVYGNNIGIHDLNIMGLSQKCD
jgi:hypothetical protein